MTIKTYSTNTHETISAINGQNVVTNCRAWHRGARIYAPGFCIHCGNREADPGIGYCDNCLDEDHKRWVREDGGEL